MLRGALLGKISIQSLAVLLGGDIGLPTSLPIGKLYRVGIDGFDLCRPFAKGIACGDLFVGGFARIWMYDHISLLDAIAGAVDDFIVFSEFAGHVGNWSDKFY